MSAGKAGLELHDFEPGLAGFRRDVLEGLRQSPQKTLPCKYFYDLEGSRLFDRICALDAYYPTRAEWAIMAERAGEMCAWLGPGCLIIEYGSGSSEKIRALLDELEAPAGYVPIDISREYLRQCAADLRGAYPGLRVAPVCADYAEAFTLPDIPAQRKAVYFPGSTIGNLHPPEAQAFLERIAEVCEPGGALLIGVDLVKDAAILEAAYNDPEGVTAAFNRNILARINRELGGDFDLSLFEHRAFWNAAESRIEMHLESLADQAAGIGGEAIPFRAGETIHTECSYKYTIGGFRALAEEAGFRHERMWTDPGGLFSVHALTAA